VTPDYGWITMTITSTHLNFSGTPIQNHQLGGISFQASRINTYYTNWNETKYGSFNILKNEEPVFSSLDDKEFEVPEIVDFSFGASSLYDPESLHMDVSIKVNNSDPPSWLLFDASTLHFQIVSVSNAHQGEHNITVYAKDDYNPK